MEDIRTRIKRALEGDGHELFTLTQEILRGNKIEEFENVLEEVLKESTENATTDDELKERLEKIAERARVLYMAMFVAALRARS